MTGIFSSPARGRRVVHTSGVAVAAVLAMATGVSAAGQVRTPPPGSLVVDPQQGATPRPLPTPAPQPSRAGPPERSAPPIPTLPVPAAASPAPIAGTAATQAARSPEPVLRGSGRGLPPPEADPLAIDPQDDPVLRLTRSATEAAAFRSAIADAVRRAPSLDEAAAQVEEADAIRDEARARVLPTADVSVSTFRVFSRAFSNDPGNVLERSRPRRRTDVLMRVQQPVVDWGAGLDRIRAGEARREAARAGVEDVGAQVALRAIAAWYQVYGYRVLVRLAEGFAGDQRDLKDALRGRIAQGAAAPADIAQVDGYIAAAEAQSADFRRLLSGAEAQYTAVIGTAAPADLGRAPPPGPDGVAPGALADAVDRLPAVRAARLEADAANREARAFRADRLPQLTAGIDAGRYGLIETDRDYDVRGNLTMSMRLGGGGAERARQAAARATGAEARLRRTRTDAQRDAEIALGDIAALEAARTAIEANYIASRRSRDVLAERFRVSRGTLFDLLAAQSNYFGVAARYIQTVIELDSARYAFLARTGRLLPSLGIDPSVAPR